MKDYSKIDFNEVFRLLGLMEECVTRVHALQFRLKAVVSKTNAQIYSSKYNCRARACLPMECIFIIG
ncbi:hypothetical protein IANJMKHF_00090 [Klebsiella phage CPRSA]|nr:hypothetical protein IANJMKHF_00090 [Klebsiella phage CPRSA]